ncbi:MAG: rhodanese-like domain-containing protein [Deltaproteobacteria bacterium]|nr:rhodanese-like domain-containing protein [Deltaproteobacteria bacterium]
MRFSAVRVSGSDARNLVAKGATLLDVRSSQEFSSGHIDGAVSISVQELAGRLDELGDKNGAIVVYCQSGSRSAMAKRLLGRSAMAKRLLASNGFTNVHDMGGIGEW